MDEAEQLLYDGIHQRCPPNQILGLLKDITTIHVQSLIEEFGVAQSINPYYAKTIIKCFIDNAEIFDENQTKSPGKITVAPFEGIFLTEWLYEMYIELLNVARPSPTTKDIVQYRFNSKVKIKIEESPKVISGSGTTGFRTWEAALFLSSYLLQNDFHHKCVLELGAGTSMVSATVAKAFGHKLEKLYITDGDSTLLEAISRRNFLLNDLTDGNKYLFRRLWWNEDPTPEDMDLVLAADVTYDASVVPDLCACLLQCLNRGRSVRCLVSATIRNEETIQVFEDELLKFHMKFEVVCSTETSATGKTLVEGLQGSLIAPIRIYSIVKYI